MSGANYETDRNWSTIYRLLYVIITRKASRIIAMTIWGLTDFDANTFKMVNGFEQSVGQVT